MSTHITFHNFRVRMSLLLISPYIAIVYISTYELDHMQYKFYIRLFNLCDDYCHLFFKFPSINCWTTVDY